MRKERVKKIRDSIWISKAERVYFTWKEVLTIIFYENLFKKNKESYDKIKNIFLRKTVTKKEAEEIRKYLGEGLKFNEIIYEAGHNLEKDSSRAEFITKLEKLKKKIERLKTHPVKKDTQYSRNVGLSEVLTIINRIIQKLK